MVNGFRLPKILGGLKVAPQFTPAFLMLAIPFTIAAAIEWRLIVPWHQYKGVFPGDVFLSVAIGWTIYLNARYLPCSDRRYWYRSVWWHLSCLGFGVGFVALTLYGEIGNTINQWVPDVAYTVWQMVSPSHTFHLVILVVAGYVGMSTFWPMLFHVPRQMWWAKLVIVLLIAAWIYCFGYLDNNSPRPNINDIHPLNGGWFGPYGQKLWYALVG